MLAQRAASKALAERARVKTVLVRCAQREPPSSYSRDWEWRSKLKT